MNWTGVVDSGSPFWPCSTHTHTKHAAASSLHFCFVGEIKNCDNICSPWLCFRIALRLERKGRFPRKDAEPPKLESRISCDKVKTRTTDEYNAMLEKGTSRSSEKWSLSSDRQEKSRSGPSDLAQVATELSYHGCKTLDATGECTSGGWENESPRCCEISQSPMRWEEGWDHH